MTYRAPDEYDQTILSLAAGDLLSERYRLIREIGRGGMGIVWLAEDTTLDDRKVALKLLPSVLCSNERAVGRLKREATTCLDLTHTHIIRLLTFERDINRGNMAYLVMQYVDGRTLDDLLAKYPDGLPTDRVLKWAEQIAGALDYAHGKNVLHRDIKPTNIMIDRDDNAFLMDFGIAREAKDTMTRVTGRDSSGTLPYMSPQQVDGQNHTSNDIYSLAATIYEALKGDPPFTTGDIYQQIKHVEVSPIEGQSDHVNKALLRGLAKQREDRPENARTLVGQLMNTIQDLPKTDWEPKRENPNKLVDSTEADLRASIEFDVQEFIRGIMKGKGSKAYLERAYEERLEDWKKAANLGWPEGQYLLGRCYDEGLGVPKQVCNAFLWYRKAAEQGFAVAQCSLGVCYANGEGASKDESEAVKWFRKAAEQGLAMAQCNLGFCYANGKGVSKDESEAVKWYRKAAEQGYAWAQCLLGVCYAKGMCVSKDESEAVKWFRKAAEQGDADAQCALGGCYAEGTGVNKDELEALKLFRKAAEQENALGQFALGSCYDEGIGVNKDELEAVKWYRKAAEQGYADAQCELGNCYAEGTGVYKDELEAVKWYRKAAEQGLAMAQCSLGYCYISGEGVSEDISEAVKWVRKAAEQGNTVAQHRLGRCYYFGIGVSKDESEAKKWCRKAAEQGYEPAKKALRDSSTAADIGGSIGAFIGGAIGGTIGGIIGGIIGVVIGGTIGGTIGGIIGGIIGDNIDDSRRTH